MGRGGAWRQVSQLIRLGSPCSSADHNLRQGASSRHATPRPQHTARTHRQFMAGHSPSDPHSTHGTNHNSCTRRSPAIDYHTHKPSQPSPNGSSLERGASLADCRAVIMNWRHPRHPFVQAGAPPLRNKPPPLPPQTSCHPPALRRHNNNSERTVQPPPPSRGITPSQPATSRFLSNHMTASTAGCTSCASPPSGRAAPAATGTPISAAHHFTTQIS